MFRIVFVGDPYFLTILCCGVIGALGLATGMGSYVGLRSCGPLSGITV